MCIIISGFPGVGKSYAANMRNSILDLESSKFSSLGFNWEEQYVEAIIDAYNSYKYDVILISSHASVRKILAEQYKISFICVVPNMSLLNEYMIRYLRRGSTVEFIAKIRYYWSEWLNEMRNNNLCIELQSGEYILSILPW